MVKVCTLVLVFDDGGTVEGVVAASAEEVGLKEVSQCADVWLGIAGGGFGV